MAPRRRKKKKDDDDFVFLDRRSIALDLDDAKKFPEARQLMRQETFPDPRKEAGYAHHSEDDQTLSERTQELNLSTTSKQSSSQTSSKVLKCANKVKDYHIAQGSQFLQMIRGHGVFV